MTEAKEYNLKLLIDKKHGTVLFAEATKSFTDAVYNVFSDPVTFFSLIRQQETPGAGSLVNLCNSIESLNVAAAPAAEEKVYSCHSCVGSNYSDNPQAACPSCHTLMNKELEYVAPPPLIIRSVGGGLVQNVVYMISDDMEIKPLLGISGVHMIMKISAIAKEVDASALEEKLVHLNYDEVVKLVYASPHSKTVLTDFFLKADGKGQSVKEEPAASGSADVSWLSMYI